MVQRQTFILRLAKALMYFGAPSHRIESQLISVSRTLEVDPQFVHMPSIVICSFGDQETRTSETHFVKASGRLMLGKLHNVQCVQECRSRSHGCQGGQLGTESPSQIAPTLWHRFTMPLRLSMLLLYLPYGLPRLSSRRNNGRDWWSHTC